MSATTPSSSAPGAARWAQRLAWFAITVPLLVLFAIAAHGTWFGLTKPLVTLQALNAATDLGQLTVTPAGTPPRDGPGSHGAVDPRHDPLVPSFDRAPRRAPTSEAMPRR